MAPAPVEEAPAEEAPEPPAEEAPADATLETAPEPALDEGETATAADISTIENRHEILRIGILFLFLNGAKGF